MAFTEVDRLSPEMFEDDQFFYFEILGDNYHVEDIIGFAWGNSRAILCFDGCKLVV